MQLNSRTGFTHLSTSSEGLPGPEYVGCRVLVAVVFCVAPLAGPAAHAEGHLVCDVPADAAPLRGGEPAVHLHERAPVPLGFVFELADDLAPTRPGDGAGEAVVLHHV